MFDPRVIGNNFMAPLDAFALQLADPIIHQVSPQNYLLSAAKAGATLHPGAVPPPRMSPYIPGGGAASSEVFSKNLESPS